MITQLLQLAAVLAITLFLMTGCATQLVRPFDFSTMRLVEDFAKQMNKVTIWSGYKFPKSEAQDQADLAWAFYHAGQVAVAMKEYDKADEYFERALGGIKQAIKIIMEKTIYKPAPNPNRSF